jgi:hypothetical protein
MAETLMEVHAPLLWQDLADHFYEDNAWKEGDGNQLEQQMFSTGDKSLRDSQLCSFFTINCWLQFLITCLVFEWFIHVFVVYYRVVIREEHIMKIAN